jgi:serine/threonine protein kinase
MSAFQTLTRKVPTKGDGQGKEQSTPDPRLSWLPHLQSSSIWLRWKRNMSVKIIRLQVQHITKNSAILASEAGTRTGSLVKTRVMSRKDFKLGNLVGEGTFTRVFNIVPYKDLGKIELNDQVAHTYVIKQLRPEVMDLRVTSMKTFQKASTDITMEALYLARLDHPNIVQIHGVSSAIHKCMFPLMDEEPAREDDFFFVMPRIRETLDERIQHWKEKRNADKKEIFPVQCRIGLQLAQVLSFLQEKRIIYRNLKTSNVGLQGHSIVKLFDFGTSRELPRAQPYDPTMSKEDLKGLHYYHDKTSAFTIPHHDQVFQMSFVGSPAFMAPELLKIPCLYNGKCDVYSWSILMAHLLTLAEPFAGVSHAERFQRVVVLHERPVLADLKLPDSLEHLIRRAWAADLSVRPSIHQVRDHMELIVIIHDSHCCTLASYA